MADIFVVVYPDTQHNVIASRRFYYDGQALDGFTACEQWDQTPARNVSGLNTYSTDGVTCDAVSVSQAAPAFQTIVHGSGKWVFSIQFGHVSVGSEIGLGNIAASSATAAFLGSDGNSFGYSGQGNGFINGTENTSNNTITGFGDNDQVDLAIDLDNKVYWIRSTSFPNWNGIGGASPGDANGFSISNLLSGNFNFYPAVYIVSDGTGTATAQIVPPPTITGFSAWGTICSDNSRQEPHFIGKYQQTKYSFFRYNSTPNDVPVSGQPETNTHFIGRYSVAQLKRFPYNVDDNSKSGPLGTQPETNTHFVGRYAPSRLKALASYWQLPDVSVSVPQPQPETNTHFIGRYRIGQMRAAFGMLWQPDTSQSAPLGPQIEANPHFIGRYKVARLAQFAYNSQADIPLFVPQPETNPHFVGKYAPTQYRFLVSLRHVPDTSTSAPQPIQPETNPHFLGRYRASQLRSRLEWRQNVDRVSLPILDVSPHFIGKYNPGKLRALIGYRQNHFVAPTSAASLAVETNTHFIGRYRPATLRYLADHRQNTAQDFSSVVTQIGRSNTQLPPVSLSKPHGAGTDIWLGQVARTMNQMLSGRLNATISVTLNANFTYTVLQDNRIGPSTHVSLMPLSASAAAALASGQIWFEITKGSVTIHHPAAPATDQTFGVLLIG